MSFLYLNHIFFKERTVSLLPKPLTFHANRAMVTDEGSTFNLSPIKERHYQSKLHQSRRDRTPEAGKGKVQSNLSSPVNHQPEKAEAMSHCIDLSSEKSPRISHTHGTKSTPRYHLNSDDRRPDRRENPTLGPRTRATNRCKWRIGDKRLGFEKRNWGISFRRVRRVQKATFSHNLKNY
ncbi:hypothetical protein V6N12_051602 [Hibiscus sabdariffa]|uniref:Uncharacterized protein n=1 Tax=Hibiscus sabdariffa TaxID=183260 RepID=A0ABR2GFS7_9ROSI